jgi:hypothetical protein
MKEHSIFVGMDVHKNSIDIAIAEKGRQGHLTVRWRPHRWYPDKAATGSRTTAATA